MGETELSVPNHPGGHLDWDVVGALCLQLPLGVWRRRRGGSLEGEGQWRSHHCRAS